MSKFTKPGAVIEVSSKMQKLIIDELAKSEKLVEELNFRIHHLNNTIAEMRRDKEVKALRDKFAGQAMQGIAAHRDNWGETIAGVAVMAYQMADLMLKEREQS